MKHTGIGGDIHAWEECQCPKEYAEKTLWRRGVLAFTAAICLTVMFAVLVS